MTNSLQLKFGLIRMCAAMIYGHWAGFMPPEQTDLGAAHSDATISAATAALVRRLHTTTSPPVVSTIMGTTDARVRTSASLYCPSFCLTQPLPVAWMNGPWLLRPISLQPRMSTWYVSSDVAMADDVADAGDGATVLLGAVAALCVALVGDAHLAS